ncbi:MAG: phasin family protein, partial [Geminicoccaceae bacterium]
MPANKSKTPNLFDPEALLEAQRRNFTAFTSAGNIVATGMRSYAERQVTMMQESMKQLWSVMQASAAKPTAGAAPTQQMEQMRSAFEKVLAQVNDLGNHLLKVQSEAMAVLNECASKNFEVLGGAAPELAALQQKAKDAFASASTQTTAVIDEMKKRMASLEEETK